MAGKRKLREYNNRLIRLAQLHVDDLYEMTEEELAVAGV